MVVLKLGLFFGLLGVAQANSFTGGARECPSLATRDVAIPPCMGPPFGRHHVLPRALLFMPVGLDNIAVAEHSCNVALKAGLDLYLVHYDRWETVYKRRPFYKHVKFSRVDRSPKSVLIQRYLVNDTAMQMLLEVVYSHMYAAD
jgi:hypothetical protein